MRRTLHMPARSGFQRSRVFHAVCLQALERLLATTSGVHSALVLSGDGVEIASLMRPGLRSDRLAPMLREVQLCSDDIAKEAALPTPCSGVILGTDAGAVVVAGIRTTDAHLLLAALCDDSVAVGSVWFAARLQAVAIGERLEAVG